MHRSQARHPITARNSSTISSQRAAVLNDVTFCNANHPKQTRCHRLGWSHVHRMLTDYHGPNPPLASAAEISARPLTFAHPAACISSIRRLRSSAILFGSHVSEPVVANARRLRLVRGSLRRGDGDKLPLGWVPSRD